MNLPPPYNIVMRSDELEVEETFSPLTFEPLTNWYHLVLELNSFLVAQTVKNLPAMRETWVRSLGWEDPLEEGMATHFSILTWRIPMDRGTWQATVHGVAKHQT